MIEFVSQTKVNGNAGKLKFTERLAYGLDLAAEIKKKGDFLSALRALGPLIQNGNGTHKHTVGGSPDYPWVAKCAMRFCKQGRTDLALYLVGWFLDADDFFSINAAVDVKEALVKHGHRREAIAVLEAFKQYMTEKGAHQFVITGKIPDINSEIEALGGKPGLILYNMLPLNGE